MPVSTVLLERLKKRGIVMPPAGQGAEHFPDAAMGDDDEEVFAESYDPEDPVQHKPETKEHDDGDRFRGGAPGCPNKNNQFHVCTEFCFDHWGDGYPESRLPEKYLEWRKKMLREYPLPDDWKEVYDAGIRRHYYWNTRTDDVCWVSPKHPRAVIGEAAPKLAKEMLENGMLKFPNAQAPPSSKRADDSSLRNKERGAVDRGSDRDRRENGGNRRDRRRERRRRNSSADEDDASAGIVVAAGGSSDDEERSRRRAIEVSDRDRLKRARRKGIDPMDPAAYSDVSTGSWSTGLYDDTKTGVDVTASGPLFQQRPYPAPGAILRKQNPDQAKKD